MGTVDRDLYDEYERILIDRRESDSDQDISNRYPWHCKLAFQQLLTHAIELQQGNSADPIVVRLLTGTCNNHIYGNPVALALVDEFIALGGKVRVIVWAERIDSNCTLVKKRDVEARPSGTADLADQLNHFIVVGDTSYRFEEKHKETSADRFNDFEPEVPATICFSGNAVASQLVKFFDDIWQVLGKKRGQLASVG